MKSLHLVCVYARLLSILKFCWLANMMFCKDLYFLLKWFIHRFLCPFTFIKIAGLQCLILLHDVSTCGVHSITFIHWISGILSQPVKLMHYSWIYWQPFSLKLIVLRFNHFLHVTSYWKPFCIDSYSKKNKK